MFGFGPEKLLLPVFQLQLAVWMIVWGGGGQRVAKLFELAVWSPVARWGGLYSGTRGRPGLKGQRPPLSLLTPVT